MKAPTQSTALSPQRLAAIDINESRIVAIVDSTDKIEAENTQTSVVEDEASSGPSIEGTLVIESEEPSRPPFLQPFKRSPDSIIAGTLGKDGIGSFVSGRPTMLSRVVTVRKRGRDSLGSAPVEDEKLTQPTNFLTVGDKKLLVENLMDRSELIEFSPTEDSVIPLLFLSPIGSTIPIVSQIGKLGATATGLKRFVSPNTANVASALSLLSRLPYCQPNN